jgi:predicted membrane chloride channel (bestrophin family)
MQCSPRKSAHFSFQAFLNISFLSFGTVLGLIVSFRGAQSLQRYTEGRKLWATLILSSRTFARIVWFQLSSKSSA